ncbi:MAG: carbohydrate binding domain-containing protein [Pirellulaceae bacterium]|jgi:hypothetical protein|nr:carbohydrate binding domain-containing protein [Pirellulaceae bacterium]
MIAVLGVALIVSVIGVSAVIIGRVQRRSFVNAFDMIEARQLAQAAVKLALQRIDDDPNWRYTYPNGAWETDVALGAGAYSIEGIDPADNDLTDSTDDAVEITGIGKKGTAIQKLKVTIITASDGLNCLDVTLLSGGDLDLGTGGGGGITLTCDQLIASNADVNITYGSVTSDVDAAGTITNDWAITGTVTTGVPLRQLPDRTTVLDHYESKGVVIPYASLPTTSVEFCQNPDFETDAASWQASTSPSCTIAHSTAFAHSGTGSLFVSGRPDTSAGAEYDVTTLVHNGKTYEVTYWAKASTGSETMRPTMYINGGQSFNGAPTIVTTSWTQLTATITPSWGGPATSIVIRFESDFGGTNVDFYLDDVSIKEKITGGGRMLYGQLLTPDNNPFGATQAEGIYVIDCGSQPLAIERCRIHGTLVLKNPHDTECEIRSGPLNWEPAVTNYPSLLVYSADAVATPKISMTNTALQESELGINFNPSGSEYHGNSNGTATDSYPSEIRGIVYCDDDFELIGHPTIRGVILAHDKLTASDDFDLYYDSVHAANPPPGFLTNSTTRILLQSASKVID